MTIISSQRYLDYDIVDEKIEELKGETEITINVNDVEMNDLDGNNLYLLFDKHHTFEAAKELELEIKFESISHPEGLTGEDLLESCYIDSDYYYIKDGNLVW